MELYLQFGHGMKALSRELLERWGGGTVILSPRDIDRSRLRSVATEIHSSGGQVLFDPQFYLPRSDHPRLTKYHYWPSDFDTPTFPHDPALKTMVKGILDLGNAIGCQAHIVPGPYAARVDEDWFAIQEALVEESRHQATAATLIATICLSAEALRFEEQVHQVLERAEAWPVNGFYIVAEHPKGSYLVDDPMWLTSVLDLCAGLRLLGKPVVVGYCNQQQLALAAADVDAIASGTWMNVRSFPRGKFMTQYDEQRRRVPWYYCPQALSEFRVPFLDMAHRARVLQQMRAHETMGSTYADVLFSGAQPSTTTFGEREAFRHFLCCLRSQATTSVRSTFRETVTAQSVMLRTARQLLDRLHGSGVLAQYRDFGDIIDAQGAAFAALQNSRGFVLERRWGESGGS